MAKPILSSSSLKLHEGWFAQPFSIHNKGYPSYANLFLPLLGFLPLQESLCENAKSGGLDEYRPTCSSRTVDGLVRGLFYGVMWGFMFHPFPSSHGMSPLQRAKSFGRPYIQTVSRDSWTIASFLGVYNGSQCAFEEFRETKDSWNNVLALGCAGGALLAHTRHPSTVAYSFGGTCFAVSLMYFGRWPPPQT
ncbi:unnamed protein product [Heterosigma akashiwo]|mmetsp:Transcript_9484/g.17975  ORF Transcript_9484/g.17975 Transcript_9484/m.17975 type:complete len:192 (-) Transcript_9484:94-669(-)